jgi:hypothetical protein
MSLKDYKDRESQSDNGEKGRQSMNVYWTRSFQGDLKKVLENVPEPGKVIVERISRLPILLICASFLRITTGNLSQKQCQNINQL